MIITISSIIGIITFIFFLNKRAEKELERVQSYFYDDDDEENEKKDS